MNGNGKITLRESVHTPRKVAWFCIGKTYQIRTANVIFALARILRKEKGDIEVEFFGVSQTRGLRRPNTPLLKSMQSVRQVERLPINTILEAREVLL